MLTAFTLASVLVTSKVTDVTFVRHGETVANATGVYNSKTLNTFSEKGEKGVSDLTKRLLKQPKWDLILVSPSPRALKTIAPYLKATGQKATVWPLLYECCTGGKKPKSTKPLAYGAVFAIPSDIAPQFIVEKGKDRLPNAPEYGQGLVQIDEAVAEFKKNYMGKRILLVGHSGNGGQLINRLTGKWIKVENTTEIPFTLK